MRRSAPVALALLTMLVSADAANACGRKCGGHRRRHQTVAYPMTYASPTPQAYSTPAPVMAAAPAPAYAASAPVAPATAPSYEYTARPEAGGAYYYTYDDSGKLIIQQWGDWLFRGGKDAGMPRPPLPIVGYLQRR